MGLPRCAQSGNPLFFRRRGLFKISAALLVLGVTAGCSYSMRSDWTATSTVAVPIFADSSITEPGQAGIAGEVTAALRNLIIEKGELTLAAAGDTDYRVEGRISSCRVVTVSTDRYGDPVSARYLILAVVSLHDMRSGRMPVNNAGVSSAGLSTESGAFDLSLGESIRAGRRSAIDNLALAVYHRLFELGSPSANTVRESSEND